MSIVQCIHCDRKIDTDFETDYLDYGDDPVCASCLYDLETEREEDERLDDPRHGQADGINKNNS